MTTDVLDTLAAIRTDRERVAADNRARFPDAAADLDVIRANGFPNATIRWAQNAAGNEIGKRDPGPWINAEVLIRADDYARNRIRSVRAGKAV
jgi:hypothetical protein